MALIMSVAAKAEDITVYSLYVNTAAGDAVEYKFADKPVATFSGEDLVITTTGAAAVNYPMADVKNITFKTTTVSGVEDVAATDHLAITLTKTELRVCGLADGAEVSVYSVAGQLMARAEARQGEVVIAIAELPEGVYAAAVPGHSFKFVK